MIPKQSSGKCPSFCLSSQSKDGLRVTFQTGEKSWCHHSFLFAFSPFLLAFFFIVSMELGLRTLDIMFVSKLFAREKFVSDRVLLRFCTLPLLIFLLVHFYRRKLQELR